MRAGRMRRARRALLGIAAAGAALALGATPAWAGTIGWGDFENAAGTGLTHAPSLEDRIRLVQTTDPSLDGRIEVVLRTSPAVTWRKGIELDRRGRGCAGWGWFQTCWAIDELIAGMVTQDGDHGPASRRIAVQDACNANGCGRLRFGKAKALGSFDAHRYELRWDAAHAQPNRRYTFTWLRG